MLGLQIYATSKHLKKGTFSLNSSGIGGMTIHLSEEVSTTTTWLGIEVRIYHSILNLFLEKG